MVLALGYLSPQSCAPVLALSIATLRQTSVLSGGSRLRCLSVCLPVWEIPLMSPFWKFLGDRINPLRAVGEAQPLEVGAVHLWGTVGLEVPFPVWTVQSYLVATALLSALWFGVGKARTTRPWDTANLAQPLRASLGSGMRQGAEEVIQSLKQSLLLSLCHYEK